MRRPDFLKWAAALWCGRRDGTGPPPPASTVLRIALARDGLRPPLTPETLAGHRASKAGSPRGLPPVSSGALPPAAAHTGRITPAPRTERHWNTTATTGHKRTLVRRRQQEKITRLTGGQPQS